MSITRSMVNLDLVRYAGWWFGNVWNMNFMTFHSVGNGIIIPIDFHSMIFQRGRTKKGEKPPVVQ